jgi:hypothetical protein
MLGAENLKKKRNSKKNSCLQGYFFIIFLDFNVEYDDGSYVGSEE